MGHSCDGESVHGISRRHTADTATGRHDDHLRTHLVHIVAAW